MMPAVVLVAIHLLSGSLGLAPCTILLRVAVEPKTENRSIAVTLESPDFASVSQQQLEGASAPKTQRQQAYKDLPAGEYEIRATVSRIGLRDVATRAQFLCS